jgi:3-dehydroquinate synthase
MIQVPEFSITRIEAYIKKGQYSKIIVLCDENTSRLCMEQLVKELPMPIERITLLPGEHSKNLENAAYIWDQLLELDADRKAVLINLGGGMITDIGGFCASSYKRGIAFINLPTTLLGMVDAAIGGKTSINIRHYKNQVGLFAFPEAVFIDPVFLGTLPKRELIAGYAEILKYGLIQETKVSQQEEDKYSDQKDLLWEYIKYEEPVNIPDWIPIIKTCVDLKEAVVAADPKEKGLRKILNYGHTIGHAIESFSLDIDEVPLLHGESIAVGMIAEAYLSYKKTGLSKEALNDISAVIIRIFGKYIFENPGYDDLIHYMHMDKKNQADEIRFVLLEKIGKALYDVPCTIKEIKESLDYYLTL